MKVFRTRLPLKKYPLPAVAIGVFDGVHLGHRRILSAAVRRARLCRGTSIALTFYPHPKQQKIIYSLQHRLRIFQEMGIDVCVVIPFDKRFKEMTARRFVSSVLSGRLGARDVFVGDNFRFGKDQHADVAKLRGFGREFGFRVHAFAMVRCGKNAVSSTSIRGLISAGRFLAAMRRLGRPVAILGTVIHGSSIGKKLGFATANISPHHEVVPPDGIYAVKLVLEGRQYRGICYIGTRPTFSAGNHRPKERTIEVHIFDFSRTIYGKEIEVRFAGKIRDDRRFSSSDLLIKQINKDIAKARNMLSSRHSRHNLCRKSKPHY